MKRTVLLATLGLLASSTVQAQVPEKYLGTFIVEDCARGNPRLKIEATKMTYAFMSSSDRGPLLNYGACGFRQFISHNGGHDVSLYCRKAIGPGSTDPFTITQWWRLIGTKLVVKQNNKTWTYQRCPEN